MLTDTVRDVIRAFRLRKRNGCLRCLLAALYRDKGYLDQVTDRLNTGLLQNSSSYARAAYDVGTARTQSQVRSDRHGDERLYAL